MKSILALVVFPVTAGLWVGIVVTTYVINRQLDECLVEIGSVD